MELVVPAFSIAEPFETLGRRAHERREMKKKLEQDLALLERSVHYASQARSHRPAVLLLSIAADQEQEALLDTLELVLRTARSIPVDASIVKEARAVVRSFGLKSPDAIIYSSVLFDLVQSPVDSACFVTTNRKDFSDPDIVRELGSHDCKLLYDFQDVVGYVKSRTP